MNKIDQSFWKRNQKDKILKLILSKREEINLKKGQMKRKNPKKFYTMKMRNIRMLRQNRSQKELMHKRECINNNRL